MPRRRYVPIVLSILVVALVGASRIYLGAHWLSDVLGGYALGGMWLGALVAGMLGRGERGAGKTGTPKVVERPG
jgi:undecaprenyl-diphosphatase